MGSPVDDTTAGPALYPLPDQEQRREGGLRDGAGAFLHLVGFATGLLGVVRQVDGLPTISHALVVPEDDAPAPPFLPEPKPAKPLSTKPRPKQKEPRERESRPLTPEQKKLRAVYMKAYNKAHPRSGRRGAAK